MNIEKKTLSMIDKAAANFKINQVSEPIDLGKEKEMSNALKHAQREFEILEASWDKTDEDKKPIVLEFKDEILALVDKFGESGQSGGSAPFVAGAISTAIKHLCMFEIMSPLTGAEDEWTDISYIQGQPGSSVYQNKRDGAIFKDLNNKGQAQYLNAIIWQGPDEWDSFTGRVDGVHSALIIKEFPFRPKRFYIDVTRERNDTDPDRVSCGDGDYIYHIKDRSQLDQVRELYIIEEEEEK